MKILNKNKFIAGMTLLAIAGGTLSVSAAELTKQDNFLKNSTFSSVAPNLNSFKNYVNETGSGKQSMERKLDLELENIIGDLDDEEKSTFQILMPSLESELKTLSKNLTADNKDSVKTKAEILKTEYLAKVSDNEKLTKAMTIRFEMFFKNQFENKGDCKDCTGSMNKEMKKIPTILTDKEKTKLDSMTETEKKSYMENKSLEQKSMLEQVKVLLEKQDSGVTLTNEEFSIVEKYKDLLEKYKPVKTIKQEIKKDRKTELKDNYKKQYTEKLSEKLKSMDSEKLKNALSKIDVALSKFSNNEKITAQLIALKEIINSILYPVDETTTDFTVESLIQ